MARRITVVIVGATILIASCGKGVEDGQPQNSETETSSSDVGSDALSGLLRQLADDDREVRARAVESLGHLEDPRAVEPVIALLRDPDLRIVSLAVEALGELQDPRAIEPLIAMMKGELGFVDSTADALAKIGKPAVEPLVRTFQDPSVDVTTRAVVATALGKIGDSRALDPIVAALKGEEDYLKPYTAEALGMIGNARAVGPLIAALKNADPTVAAFAIQALERIKDPRALGPLVAVLEDENPSNRRAVVQALGTIGGDGVSEPLIAALQDEDMDVRICGVQALEKTKDPRSVEPLIALAIRDADAAVRDFVFQALVQIGMSAIEPLISIVSSDDVDIRDRTLEALQQLTQQDFGYDRDKWQTWWNQNKEAVLEGM